MIIKFNKFERAAGLFVSVAIIGSLTIAFSVALQKGWLAEKIQFATVFENADGIHSGTSVQISGLRAGSVDDVELQRGNKIKVTFSILKKFSAFVRQDSVVQLLRPFIIGERVLDISVGKDETPMLPENSLLPSNETIDFITILSNKKLISNMEKMTEIIDNLKILVHAFSDEKRAKSIVRIFDKLETLVNNLNEMSVGLAKLSKQATKHDNLEIVLENANHLTNEINDILPIIKEKAPSLESDMTKTLSNLAQITQDLRTLTPTLVEVAPTLPKTGSRTVELIDEFVVVLKALQRSFLLQSNVEEVRKEEAQGAKK